MLSSPPDSIDAAVRNYFERKPDARVIATLDDRDLNLPAYNVDDRCLIFGEVDGSTSLRDAAAHLGDLDPSLHAESEAFELQYVLSGASISPGQRKIIDRGISAVDLHTGFGQLAGLPTGWRDRQMELLGQSLGPLKVGDKPRLARLRATVGQDSQDALNWLASELFAWSDAPTGLVYLEAEAGKGKSTILAETAREQLEDANGPVPLLVPLRSVQRGAGISWEGIVSTVGVVGEDAETLRQAVRSGLVTPLLDGLDEVAGRYDPSVIEEVLRIVLKRLESQHSRLILSGRATEASHISGDDAVKVGLELPESHEQEFAEYSEIVVEHIADEWPHIQKRIPEPPLTGTVVSEHESSQGERDQIVSWLKRVFGDLGKERTLFFVQSLACIGRHYQLAGNKPFLVPSRNEPAMRPPLYDVCDLAAALACVREQDKIEKLARDRFDPKDQVDVLTWLALRASAEESLQSTLPRPNELAESIFNIDPVNENERFTAVVRQLQKHALLFATGSDDVKAGGWRPQFISDWVRATLLVRAWNHRKDWRKAEVIEPIVARSERSQQAFRYIIPEMVNKEELEDLDCLAASLVEEADDGSPEASANFWGLYVALSDSERNEIQKTPSRTTEFSDLSEWSVDGVEFPPSFGGNVLFFTDSDFSDCDFADSDFNQCDFTRASFQNCRFQDVTFRECDGPIVFEGCVFSNVKFLDGRAENLPVCEFEDCDFDEPSKFVQESPPVSGKEYGPAASFKGTTVDGRPDDLLWGDWIGVERHPVDGLRQKEEEAEVPPAIRALRALLKPFFPRQPGPGERRQARSYIRSSAVGRGVWPDGAPNQSTLQDILLSKDFTRGGREGHIYAPWSSIVEASDDAYEIRSEMIRFLMTNELGPYTRRLLEDLKDEGEW